jgi:hypothetical protein
MSKKRSHTRKSKSPRRKTTSKVRIPIRKGSQLRQFGYGVHKSAKTRQLALRKATKKYGKLSVFRKLNALAILSKRVNKPNSQVYLQDREYIKKMYMSP